MTMNTTPPPLPAEFAAIRDKYSDVFVVLAPPRTSSTAMARLFWEQPAVGYYSHEPFEVTYYDDAPLGEVVDKLEQPLDVRGLKGDPASVGGDALVVKEMPYQVGDNFPVLAGLATRCLLFLLRDPCQNIASRIEMKEEVGDSPLFPLIETGWELVARQVDQARAAGVPFMVVDTNEMRNNPEAILSQVFGRLGLPFSAEMLSWKSLPDIDLDNLGGRHSHLYRRVLESTGLQPALEPIPGVDFFPDEGGVRAHVERCLTIYRSLLAVDERVSAT